MNKSKTKLLVQINPRLRELFYSMTKKQRDFLKAYASCGDTEKAAEQVYDSSYSQVVVTKSRKIREALHILDDMDLSGLVIDREEVLSQLWYCLTREITDFVDGDGKLLAPHRLNKRASASVDAIKQRAHYNQEGQITHVDTEYKLVPKSTAIEMAMKHKQLFAPQEVEHRVVFDFSELSAVDTTDEVQAVLDAEYEKLEGPE